MLFGRLLILLLSVLPKHAMSRAAGWLANRTVPTSLRGSVYRGYSRIFGAKPEDAELPLEAYPSINAFFTRRLKPGLRPIAPGAIVSPADSGVGAYGLVTNDTLVQAKGRNYSLAALLGDKALADRMEGGTSPRSTSLRKTTIVCIRRWTATLSRRRTSQVSYGR